MVAFKLSSSATFAVLLVLSAVATTNCDVLFINNSTYFLFIEDVTDFNLQMDVLPPNEVSTFQKSLKPVRGREEFYIEQYIAVPDGVKLSLIKEAVATVFVFDNATVTIFNAVGKTEENLGVLVDYPPRSAPSPSP